MEDTYKVLASFLPSATIHLLQQMSDSERAVMGRCTNNGVMDLAFLPATMMRAIEQIAHFASQMTSRDLSIQNAYARLSENAARLAIIIDIQVGFSSETTEKILGCYRYAVRLCGWTMAERDEDGNADLLGYEHLTMDDATLRAQITECRQQIGGLRDPAQRGE